MTNNATQSHTTGRRMKIEEINRRLTDDLHSHVKRNIGRKNMQKEKSSPTVTKATDAVKLWRNKMKKNQLPVKQRKIANFTMKFGNPATPSKDVPMSKVTEKLQSSQPQLFISDQPITVMDVNFWMEAEKTRTEEERKQNEAGFARHAFNQYASDRLGYFREIPDTRHAL